MPDAADAFFLRRAIALAREGRAAGGKPFAAVLVRDGIVVHESADRSLALSDPTYHAELGVISEHCRAKRVLTLHGCTLYASAEPCPMCAGAIHWSRISRLVFSVPQTALQALSGGRPKPTVESLLGPYGQAEIVGPLLAEEGLAVFEWYTFGAAE